MTATSKPKPTHRYLYAQCSRVRALNLNEGAAQALELAGGFFEVARSSSLLAFRRRMLRQGQKAIGMKPEEVA